MFELGLAEIFDLGDVGTASNWLAPQALCRRKRRNRPDTEVACCFPVQLPRLAQVTPWRFYKTANTVGVFLQAPAVGNAGRFGVKFQRCFRVLFRRWC